MLTSIVRGVEFIRSGTSREVFPLVRSWGRVLKIRFFQTVYSTALGHASPNST